jgi:hypothetical protein
MTTGPTGNVFWPSAGRERQGRVEDRGHMAVEDFDLSDNLMIDGAVYSATGFRVVLPRKSKTEYYTDLEGFEACLILARKFLNNPRCDDPGL